VRCPCAWRTAYINCQIVHRFSISETHDSRAAISYYLRERRGRVETRGETQHNLRRCRESAGTASQRYLSALERSADRGNGSADTEARKRNVRGLDRLARSQGHYELIVFLHHFAVALVIQRVILQ